MTAATLPPLSRAAGDAGPPAPIRLVHLGLGNFFRSHQAWYTDRAADAPAWGYAAFAGRRAELAAALRRQQGLYTLVERGPQRDAATVIASLTAAHAGDDHEAWLRAVASPAVALITITVTEAGYCRRTDGGLDTARPDVAADVARLRADRRTPVTTAPARLLAGLAARRAADGPPLALVPCDNVPANGALTRRVVTELAALVDPALLAWVERSVTVVSTVVDRITPRVSDADVAAASRATGRADAVPVVAEPFAEWVLAGTFPAGRPRWETAGATFTDDVTGYEQRKLWLLNGAHSLLAYAGSVLAYRTVAQAIADERCRRWVEQWWATAAPHLGQPAATVRAYQEALLARFTNPRLADALARIAEDGSQKLPVRVLPVLRAERGRGRLPTAATRILAAWVCHLRGLGAPVHDVRADDLVPLAPGAWIEAVRRVLEVVAPDLAADTAVVVTVAEQAEALANASARLPG